MNLLRITITAFFIFMLSYGAASAQHALLISVDDFCIQDDVGSEQSRLFRVDPETGQIVSIGPIGFDAVTGMAQLGDGRLVGSARADADGDRISILIEINPLTGTGTLIGTIGNNNEGGCGRVPDLTYDAATDTLYGIGFRCIPGDSHGGITELLTINQNTGEGTTVGQTGFFGGGNGLAISPGGTLFSSENEEFLTLDPDTGQGTLVANHPPPGDFVMSAMDFQPETGDLFGVAFRFGEGFPTDLVTINTATAVLTTILELPVCSDAMVFIEIPPRPIPTLSEWGLIATAGVLGIIGFFALRRRRAAV